MKIVAYKRPDGTYYLDGNTYHARDRIKTAGGSWDGRHWNVTDAQRIALGYERMVWVTITGCHVKPDRELVIESQAVIGASVQAFCDRCDSRYRTEIIAVEA